MGSRRELRSALQTGRRKGFLREEGILANPWVKTRRQKEQCGGAENCQRVRRKQGGESQPETLSARKRSWLLGVAKGTPSWEVFCKVKIKQVWKRAQGGATSQEVTAGLVRGEG